MRRLMFLAAALVAVVCAGVAYAAATPSAKLQKQDRVWGGGYVAPDTCSPNLPGFCPPGARHYAIDAHAEGDGGEAVGTSAFNNFTSVTVTCLRVDGDTATVGGVVAEAAAGSGANPGDYFLQHFVDRGTSSPAAQRDFASGVHFGSPTSAWPGFPNVCPPADESSGFGPAYLPLAGGDITVQDAPSD